MHIPVLKIMTKKLGGDQYIAGPPNLKVGGDLSPPVPMVVAPMIDRSQNE